MLFRVMNPYYTVESKGKSKEGSSVRGIRMVVKVDPREKDGFKIVQWLDFSL